MSEKLELYDALRCPPQEALTPIQAGRLKGKTDINPMWRIKALTEQFGPCGMGWKYTIDRQWLEEGAENEWVACCNISLYYRTEEGWSEAIPGTGANMLVAKERSGLYTSDECYKMALTDALSVACKALGVAGDIYWQQDPTKYQGRAAAPTEPPREAAQPVHRCEACGAVIKGVKLAGGASYTAQEMAEKSRERHGRVLCLACARAQDAPNPPPVV